MGDVDDDRMFPVESQAFASSPQAAYDVLLVGNDAVLQYSRSLLLLSTGLTVFCTDSRGALDGSGLKPCRLVFYCQSVRFDEAELIWKQIHASQPWVSALRVRNAGEIADRFTSSLLPMVLPSRLIAEVNRLVRLPQWKA